MNESRVDKFHRFCTALSVKWLIHWQTLRDQGVQESDVLVLLGSDLTKREDVAQLYKVVIFIQYLHSNILFVLVNVTLSVYFIVMKYFVYKKPSIFSLL